MNPGFDNNNFQGPSASPYKVSLFPSLAVCANLSSSIYSSIYKNSSSGEQGPAELETAKTWINKHVPQISKNICRFYIVLRTHTT